jgi:hypothetical protein
MKAWIENNSIRDLCENPFDSYHPDIAALYTTDVPEGTERGATLIDGVWTNPVKSLQSDTIIITPKLKKTKLTRVEFKLRFTPQERVILRSLRTSDPYVDDFFDLLEDPQLTLVDLELPQVIEAVHYMISKTEGSVDRALQILNTEESESVPNGTLGVTLA